MQIIKITFNIINFIYKFIFKITKMLFEKTLESIKRGNYNQIYIIYGLCTLFVIILLRQQITIFATIIRITLTLGLTILLVYILLNILRTHPKLGLRYKYLMGWYLAAFYYIIILIEPTNILIYFSLIFFLGFIYCGMRYLLYHWKMNWLAYSLVFLLMPFFAAVLWGFIVLILGDITKNTFFASDFLYGWMVMVLSILIMNLSILWTPFQRIDEVKVATYFLLAIFSSISYCYFLSDFIASFIFRYFDLKSIIELEDIKYFIENIIKLFSLPYLIGSVFACFSLELVSRNKNKQASKNIPRYGRNIT